MLWLNNIQIQYLSDSRKREERQKKDKKKSIEEWFSFPLAALNILATCNRIYICTHMQSCRKALPHATASLLQFISHSLTLSLSFSHTSLLLICVRARAYLSLFPDDTSHEKKLQLLYLSPSGMSFTKRFKPPSQSVTHLKTLRGDSQTNTRAENE